MIALDRRTVECVARALAADDDYAAVLLKAATGDVDAVSAAVHAATPRHYRLCSGCGSLHPVTCSGSHP